MAALDYLREQDMVMSISGNWNSSFQIMFLLIPVHLGGCWGIAANGVLPPGDLKINYMLAGGFSSLDFWSFVHVRLTRQVYQIFWIFLFFIW